MMCSAYRLNKQGDSRQPCSIPFSILSQSVVLHRVLSVASGPAYRFLRRQVRWSGIPICLRTFPCFLYNPANVDNLISSSSSFSKSNSDIWKFLVCIMLKPSMQDFKHDLPSMSNECDCLMVSTFFGTMLLENWNED